MHCILCIVTLKLVTTNPSVTDGEEGEGKRLPPIEWLKNSRSNNILCSHYLLYSPVCTKVSYHQSQYWSLWGHQRMSRMKVKCWVLSTNNIRSVLIIKDFPSSEVLKAHVKNTAMRDTRLPYFTDF